MKGRVFTSLAEENQFLLNWETQVADQRIHGTTKQQVEKLFEQAERRALLPLPAERFPFFHEAHRAVHRDGHLEVDKAYYSAPPEYVGHRLWVRWDSRLVRIFNDRWEQVAVHAKAEPGRFRTAAEHIPKEKVSAVERGTDALLRQIATDRPAHPAVGRSHDAGPRRRGRAGPGGPEASGGQAPERRLGRGLPRGAVARGLSSADRSASCSRVRARSNSSSSSSKSIRSFVP